MTIGKSIRLAGGALLLALAALLLETGPAFAVADLNVTVTSQGQPVGGATIHLSFPDGSSVERGDADGDGRIGVFLRDPGTYRMTITTPDGQMRTTTFTAPESGTVTVNYDTATGAPVVSVNDTSATKLAGRSDDLHERPISFGVFGSYGQSKWDTAAGDGSELFPGTETKVKKWGLGFALRYYLPNLPLFIANRFFWHARDRADQPGFISEFESDLEVTEKWKNQMLFGWHFHRQQRVMLTLLAGVTLARMQMVLNPAQFGDQFRTRDHMVAPTFGGEAEVLVHRAMRLYLVMGFTVALMKSFQLDKNNTLFRADSDVQWDVHTGFRVPF